MFDMLSMMGKVKEMQSKMQEVQENLGTIIVEGESGAGMVKAKANGKKQLISLEIDDALVNSAEKSVLEDLIVAAVNNALKNAELKAAEEISKNTEGLLPKIPGLDLNSMFGGK